MVSQIPNYKIYKKSCVGSIAHYFSENLIDVANERGVVIEKVVKSPIDGLVKFHTEK